MKKHIILTASILTTALAGCSGSGSETTGQGATAPRTVDATEREVTVHGDVSVSKNVFGSPVFTANGNQISGLQPLTNRGQITMQKRATPSAGNQSFTIFGESGTSQVAVIASEGTNANNAFLGSEFKRIGETDVPIEGTALMRGEYAAVISEQNSINAYHDVDYFVEGEAAIAFDFGKNTMGGEIFNRRLLREDGTLSNSAPITGTISLGETAINADGSYGGTTSGGTVMSNNFARETTAQGSFSGLLTGANGQETVGTVTVEHTDTGGVFNGDAAEVGVFHAIKQ